MIGRKKSVTVTVALISLFLSAFPSFAAGFFPQRHTTVLSVPAWIYGSLAILALIFIFLYSFANKNKDRWLLVLFISVFIADCGHFCVTISSNRYEALFADVIVRLGSALLPLSMLMTVADTCRFRIKKRVKVIFLVLSVLMFFLTSSGFYSTLYYKNISFEIENGAGRLIREFGPLYILYLLYLALCFGSMLGIIFKAFGNKKNRSLQTVVLSVLVFMNMAAWLVERFVNLKFELLSVTYVITCFSLYIIFRVLRKKDEEPLTATETLTETEKEENNGET